jgi:hypothetical protein
MAEKISFERVEKLDTSVDGQQLDADERGIRLDYSGAHAKTSPEEIALVKKLDLWIMVSTLIYVVTLSDTAANVVCSLLFG